MLSFLTCEDLVLLSLDKAKFNKKKHYPKKSTKNKLRNTMKLLQWALVSYVMSPQQQQLACYLWKKWKINWKMWKLKNLMMLIIATRKTYLVVLLLALVTRYSCQRRKNASASNKFVSEKSLPIAVRKSLCQKTNNWCSQCNRYFLESQPIIPSKWQSSISPTSKSFSPKTKHAKNNVLSKEVEMEKNKHVPKVLSKKVVMEKKKHVLVVGKNSRERKFLRQLWCQNLIWLML